MEDEFKITDEMVIKANAQVDKYMSFTFGKEEAEELAEFYNNNRTDKFANEESFSNYKFKVLKLKDSEIETINDMNRYAEQKLINTSGGYYIAAVDDTNLSGKGATYSLDVPTIFKNETGDLIFSKTNMNSLGTFNPNTAAESKYSINKFNKFDFVMANPFNNSNVVTGLDGKSKITNQILRRNADGVQEIMNANYPDFVKNILEFVSGNFYSKRVGLGGIDDVHYKMAGTVAGKTLANPTGKTTTDFNLLGQIKGTEGLNMKSTNAYTNSQYVLNADMLRDFDSDLYDKLTKTLDDKAPKPTMFKFKYTNGGNLEGVTKSHFKNGKVVDLETVTTGLGDISGQARFHEYYNNAISMARNYASPNKNISETMDSLNKIMDDHTVGDSKSLASSINKMKQVIFDSYGGVEIEKVRKILGSEGALSSSVLGSMLENGIRFHDYLDVNRQSINTEDIITQTSGAILDLGGVHNKWGQRNAQADAKMGKAVLNVGGEEFDMTQVARGWTSGVGEMGHKKIMLKNTVAEAMINKTQELLYGESLGSSYYSQQNYMIQTFHNAAFQDSNMVASDLALENVSKYDYKKPINVPYSAMNKEIFGETFGAVDFKNLSGENALVDGSIENRIFRSLIGEENYAKHVSAQTELVEAYKNVGRHMEGITNLQTVDGRKAYAVAQNEMIKEVNGIFSKYFVGVEGADARAQIINPDAVSAGQARHITGVNFAAIDGIEFTPSGVNIKTTGIVNHGDSVKFMNDAIKSTTQSVELSMGLMNDAGIYIPTSGLNSEKMNSAKRGFAGDLLQRSITTMAFNYTTLGNSDDMTENFNAWKNAMESEYTIKGVNGKNISIFEATGIDVSFDGRNMTFVNKDTQEALGGYDFRAKGLTGSVNKKINGLIESRVKDLLGVDLATNYGKGYTEKIFGEMLAPADAGLGNMITGDKNGLTEATRRALAKIHVGGNLETINVTNKGTKVNDLGWLKGLRLLVNVHAMQETKSRAGEDGLSIGRLSQQIIRESLMYDLADDIEEETIFRSVKKAEKYYALTGAGDGYEDITKVGSKAYELFSGNVVDMKSPVLRYNIDGTNTTIEKFIKNSPLGEMIGEKFDIKTGSLTGSLKGHLTGFNDQFLDMARTFTGAKGSNARTRAMSIYATSDIGKLLVDEKFGLVEEQRNALKSIINSSYDSLYKISETGDASEFARSRMMMLGKTIKTLGDEKSAQLLASLGIKSDVNATKFVMKEILSAFKPGEAFMLNETLLADKEFGGIRRKTYQELSDFFSKYNKDIDNFSTGNRLYASSSEFSNYRDVGTIEIGSADKHMVGKIINSLYTADKLDDYSSDEYATKLFADRLDSYSGKNVFNLKALNEISTQGVMRYMVDELAADEHGAIISKSSLKNLEKLIKQNADLNELDKMIGAIDHSALETQAKEKEITSEAIAKMKRLKNKYSESTEKIENKKGNLKFFDDAIKNAESSGYKALSYSDAKLMSVENKLKTLEEFNPSYLKYHMTASGIAEAGEKIDKIKELKESMIDDIFNSIIAMGEDSKYLGNAEVSTNLNLGYKAHGSIIQAAIADSKEALTSDSVFKKYAKLNSMLKNINATIDASKGSNTTSAGLMNMVDEKNILRELINQKTSVFFENADFDGNAKSTNNSIINFFKLINDVKEEDFTVGRIGKMFAGVKEVTKSGTRKSETIEEAIAGELSRAYATKVGAKSGKGNDLASLLKKREELKLNMINSINGLYSDMTENLFRKGGVIGQLSTMRFKNSVEFSPTEKTVSSNFITDEFQKVMRNRLDGTGKLSDETDMFKALRLMYGDEIVDDIYVEYSKTLSGVSDISDKEKIINKFRIGLSEKLENLSGVVIGTREDFVNAGLNNMLKHSDEAKGKGGLTTIMNGFLSRNPHQYIGSLRSTRYVALDSNDRNLSFFAGMFGERAKIAGTQGNLSLVGKRTAIAAHGDHDGDKFQALFMTKEDFKSQISKYGKKYVEDAMVRRDSGLEMYRLLGDYNGNFRKSLESGELTNVEKGILKHAKHYLKLEESATNGDVFEEIKHIYWTLRGEYRRTTAEVLDENVSHADIPYFKMLSETGKSKTAEDFEKVVSKMSDEGKLAVMANTFDFDDVSKIDSYFDDAMFNDKGFVERLNKIKAIKNNSDMAETLVKEFGDYGVGKIKWNNASLSDSSYAAYTGIARTGTIHYALTSIRDTASSLFSKDRIAKMNEALAARVEGNQITKETAESLSELLSNYKKHGRYMVGGNTFGTLIEKLAISSKLASGMNPYQAVKFYNNNKSTFIDTMSGIVQDKKTADGIVDFSKMESVFEYLSDNDNDEFDFDVFKKMTGEKGFGFMGGSPEMSKAIGDFIERDLAPTAFTTDHSDVSLGVVETLKKRGIKNSDVLKTISNTYTMLGSAVMNTVVGTENTVDAYNSGKTKFFGKNKNLFYNFFKVANDDMLYDSYNPEYGIFHGFKALLKDMGISKKTGGGGGTTPEDAIEELNAVDNGVENIENEIIVKSDAEPVNRKVIRRIEQQAENSVENMVTEIIPDNPKTNVVETTATESIELIEKEMIKSTGGSHIRAIIEQRAAEEKAIRSANSKANKSAKNVQAESNVVKTNVVETESILESVDTVSSRNLKEAEEQINRLSSETENLKTLINEKDNAMNGVQAEISSLSSQLDDERINKADLENKIASLNSKLEELNADKQKAINNMNEAVIAEQKEIGKVKKILYDQQAEHKKAINNLNANSKKALDEKDKMIEELSNKIKSLSSKITEQSGDVSELKEALKTAKTLKGGAGSMYTEVAEKVSKVGENAKKVYNNNSKVAIGAAATAVLGTVFSFLQGSRPIMDVDIRQKEYENSNGSIYQNLGSYGINTNIRSIR